MNTFRIIGLCGSAGHGKDTVAELIKSLLIEGIGYRRAFAEPLKRDLEKKFGTLLPQYFSWGVQNKRQRPEFTRTMQQWYGEMRREQDEEYWIKRWEESVEKVRAAELDRKTYVMATDLRHFNEADKVRSKGGIVIYVNRPGYIEPGVDYSHESERYIREIGASAELTVINNEDLQALKHQIQDIVYQLDTWNFAPIGVECDRQLEMPDWML